MMRCYDWGCPNVAPKCCWLLAGVELGARYREGTVKTAPALGGGIWVRVGVVWGRQQAVSYPDG